MISRSGEKPLLMRITTVPVSMQVLLRGQPRFMQQHGFDVVMVSSDGAEVEELVKQEGCRHFIIPLTRFITPVKDLQALWQLTMLMKKLKPSIVHTHTPKAGLIGMWAAWLARVPVRLHTVAGLSWVETGGVKRMILKAVERLTFIPANRVFPNSHKQRDFLYAKGIGRKKMQVLGNGSSNGIDTIHFQPTAELAEAGERLRINENISKHHTVWIFIGRLVKDKGLEELLYAFEQLHLQFPGDRLWLLGKEEPELDPLDEAALSILHNHPAVKSWGFQKDVRPFLAAADVLTFPSYREGFPNVPLQAGAMGCALILSDINGCNEIVDHGRNGLLVSAKSRDELFNAMLHLRKDNSLLQRFRANARKGIVEGYDQKKLWNVLLNQYTALLK